MTNRLPPSEMKANVDAARARAAAVPDPAATDEPGAFRRADMTRLRINANLLRAVMAAIADNDVEFTKLYGATVKDELAWEQMMIDLTTLADLARIEE